MEVYLEALQKAKRNIHIADHMIYVTFGVVKEPKLLLSVLENIFLSYSNGMAALLHRDRIFKRIPQFQETFDAKYTLFVRRCIPRYKFNEDYARQMLEIKELLVAHRNSPIEFSRKDRFVICSENYRMKSISVDDIKRFLSKAKIFIQDINTQVVKK